MKRGLTFVELLLAVAVFAILLTGLSSHLRGSVVVWRRITSTTEHLQRLRVTFDRLRNELAQAIVFDSTRVWTPDHQFKHKGFAYYTVRTGETSDKPGEVIFVTYEWDKEKKALVRMVQTPQQAHETHVNQTIRNVRERKQLLEGVEDFTIQYLTLQVGSATDLKWQDEWTLKPPPAPPTLPKLLKVTVKFGKEAHVPGEITQVVMIPTGTLTP